MLKNDALLLSVKIPNDLYQSLFSRILYSRNEQLTYFFDRLMALDEIEIKKKEIRNKEYPRRITERR